MGKRARENRQATKRAALLWGFQKGEESRWLPSKTPSGFTIDEFGELKPALSKADARRRFLRHRERLMAAEEEIMDILLTAAHSEIVALEDARVFADLAGVCV